MRGERRTRDLAQVREFFAARAAGWEDRFPDDGPKFAAAVAALAPPSGGVVLDAACGTGRALPLLRRAVGDAGTVLGVDVTPEMLGEATRLGRRTAAALVLGDVGRLPLTGRAVDAVLAAGMLPHLDGPAGGLAELARVTRPRWAPGPVPPHQPGRPGRPPRPRSEPRRHTGSSGHRRRTGLHRLDGGHGGRRGRPLPGAGPPEIRVGSGRIGCSGRAEEAESAEGV